MFRPIAILWSQTRNVIMISLHPRITDREKKETQIRVHLSLHFNCHNNRLELTQDKITTEAKARLVYATERLTS